MNAPQIHSLLVEFRASRDPEVLASLFDSTASELLEVASRIVRDDALAEDVLQNTFVAVIESIDRFDPNQEPPSGPGWLVGIVGNQARYRLRQARRSIDPRRVEAPSTVEPGRSVVVEESSDAVRAAVRTLPDVHRSVVELVLAGVGSPREIARRLGRSAGAVRVQLHRGIGMLRATLPPGVALGAAFAILEQESLAATRATVVARACAGQKSAVTAGTGVVLKLGSLVVAGGLIAGAISLRSELVESPHALAGVEAAGATSLVVADESDPISSDVASAGSTIAIVAGSESTREAVGAPASAETFDFVVTGTVGIDLAKGRIGAPEYGDVVVDENSTYLAQKQTGLGGMDDRDLPEELAVLSRSRLLAAIVDVDPRQRRFRTNDRASGVHGSLIVARLGDDSIFALSTVDMRRTATGTELRILSRRLPTATFDPAPFDPVAARAKRPVQFSGLRFDLTAAANDPIGAEIEARKQAFRDEIDHEAALLDARGPVPPGWKVRGCALREAAVTVSMIGSFDYIVSTYSFVHDTRDNVGSTRNDWEISFQGSERPVVDVTTVTDDRSKVFDLGNLDPSASIPESVAAAGTGFEEMPLSAETTYLIRTLDTETDRLDLVRVLAIRDSRFVIFGWKSIEDPVAREEILAAIAAPLPKIENGTVRIQVRGGSRGGSRVYLDGSTNDDVREVVASPLDLDGEIDVDEPHRAWVDGGQIPRGKSWRVQRVEYSATTVGDSNGPGGFRIELGGIEIVNAETSNFATTGTWTGEIVLRSGEELKSFVEIQNSSQCDVTITGEMIDAPGGG